MGLSRGEVSDLYLAGLLHDVGKIGIRDEILLKSGPLTKDEFTHMKEHPITGDRIVSKIKRLAYLAPGSGAITSDTTGPAIPTVWPASRSP